jgi:hypothetical protein
VVDLKIINNIQEVEEPLDKGQLVALTAPLILDQKVLVGFHNTSGDQGCIEIPRVEFQRGRKIPLSTDPHENSRTWTETEMGVPGYRYILFGSRPRYRHEAYGVSAKP